MTTIKKKEPWAESDVHFSQMTRHGEAEKHEYYMYHDEKSHEIDTESETSSDTEIIVVDEPALPNPKVYPKALDAYVYRNPHPSMQEMADLSAELQMTLREVFHRFEQLRKFTGVKCSVLDSCERARFYFSTQTEFCEGTGHPDNTEKEQKPPESNCAPWATRIAQFFLTFKHPRIHQMIELSGRCHLPYRHVFQHLEQLREKLNEPCAQDDTCHRVRRYFEMENMDADENVNWKVDYILENEFARLDFNRMQLTDGYVHLLVDNLHTRPAYIREKYACRAPPPLPGVPIRNLLSTLIDGCALVFYAAMPHPSIQEMIEMAEMCGKPYRTVFKQFDDFRKRTNEMCATENCTCARVRQYLREERMNVKESAAVDEQKMKEMLKAFRDLGGSRITQGHVHLIMEKTNLTSTFIRSRFRTWAAGREGQGIDFELKSEIEFTEVKEEVSPPANMDSDDSDDVEIQEDKPADKEDDKDANGKRASGSGKNAKISMTKGDNYTKLTFTQCSRIISQIEMNPCLWNLREKDYKDTPLKNGLWADIEKSVEFLKRDRGCTLRKVWNTLVAAYRVERKASMKPSGSSSAKARPSFPYYEEMGFLDNVYRDKSPPPIHNETIGFVRRDVGVDTPKRMKREKYDWQTGSDDADADLKLFMKESREVLRSFGQRRNDGRREFEAVTKLLTETLRSIPPTSQLLLQGEIAQLCEKYKKKDVTLTTAASSSGSGEGWENLDNF
ncbi:unnamed protein product [Caenorhabditis sp. 36 PRJEB53466]|nr:unnamed protein product [Caenorhabditis sp. 36 PRJEB53466]